MGKEEKKDKKSEASKPSLLASNLLHESDESEEESDDKAAVKPEEKEEKEEKRTQESNSLPPASSKVGSLMANLMAAKHAKPKVEHEYKEDDDIEDTDDSLFEETATVTPKSHAANDIMDRFMGNKPVDKASPTAQLFSAFSSSVPKHTSGTMDGTMALMHSIVKKSNLVGRAQTRTSNS